MTDDDVNVRGIERELDTYVKFAGDEHEFVTGWILVAAVSSSSLDDIGHNGYITITSDGLPHHAQLGLLAVAQQDKQAGANLSAFYALSNAIGDEDWEEDD